jgi:hypothetical protein
MKNMHLSNPIYQDKLYELLRFYDSELQSVIDLATIENNGNRPKNVENEIYSAFHHICRSVFHKNDVEEACKELETARNSHLARVQSDAYKIVLDLTLERTVRCVRNYELILLDRDFRDALPDAVQMYQKIRQTYKQIKMDYYEAKRYERLGDRSKTVAKYNDALAGVPVLDGMIEDFRADERFNVALLSVQQKRKSEKRQEGLARLGTVSSVIAAAAALLMACLTIIR